MPKWTVEFDGGGHVEVEARSEYHARRQALGQNKSYYDRIVEVRPFAAKARKQPKPGEMPSITVIPDPFEKLKSWKKGE